MSSETPRTPYAEPTYATQELGSRLSPTNPFESWNEPLWSFLNLLISSTILITCHINLGWLNHLWKLWSHNQKPWPAIIPPLLAQWPTNTLLTSASSVHMDTSTTKNLLGKTCVQHKGSSHLSNSYHSNHISLGFN